MVVQLQALFFSTTDGNERPSSFLNYFFPTVILRGRQWIGGRMGSSHVWMLWERGESALVLGIELGICCVAGCILVNIPNGVSLLSKL
jgi:hypothetical protein